MSVGCLEAVPAYHASIAAGSALTFKYLVETGESHAKNSHVASNMLEMSECSPYAALNSGRGKRILVRCKHRL